MKIIMVDSGGANIASIGYALKRLSIQATFTDNPSLIRAADRVILPGVGAAKHAMQHLAQRELIEVIQGLTQPVLGICLGMQLLYEASEKGNVQGLGIVPGQVTALAPQPGLTLPHMGWNTMQWQDDQPEDYFYFVHSYCAPVNDTKVATCTYGQTFTAVCQHHNFIGMQCHPEKSGPVGARFLQRFVEQGV